MFRPYTVEKISLSKEIEKFVFEIDSAITLEKDKQSGKKRTYSP